MSIGDLPSHTSTSTSTLHTHAHPPYKENTEYNDPTNRYSSSTSIMPSLAAARAINASFSASYTPVALFVGGTSGIGEGTARAFARATRGQCAISRALFPVLILSKGMRTSSSVVATRRTPSESSRPFPGPIVPDTSSFNVTSSL